MRKVWTAIFLFLLTTVVAGCGLGDDEASVAELPPIPNVEIVEDKNEPVVMDVYWDATCSMQGYTTIPQNNIYLGLPDNLEDIGTNLGEVHFFRFGENITPMEGRQHRKFMESGFYNEVITSANKVIENSDPNHLSIILTDLFETDADWSNLAKQIKEKYFLKYQSVAVIGIKNPFKGDIFDVGYENSGKIFYDSGLDTVKFRPFYMLVMGSDKDVRSFITKCKERMGNDERVKYLLFTNKMVDKVPDLTTMDTSNMKNIFIDSKLTINDKRLIEYGIDSQDEEVDINGIFDYAQLADVCPIDKNKLQSVVSIHYLKDGVWEEETDKSKIKMQLDQSEEAPDKFQWSVRFVPQDLLPPDSIVLIEAFVSPGRDGLQLPDWVREWNMDSQGAYDLTQFDGSKTVNFVKLVSSLKDNCVSAEIPSIANMFVVIKN